MSSNRCHCVALAHSSHPTSHRAPTRSFSFGGSFVKGSYPKYNPSSLSNIALFLDKCLAPEGDWLQGLCLLWDMVSCIATESYEMDVIPGWLILACCRLIMCYGNILMSVLRALHYAHIASTFLSSFWVSSNDLVVFMASSASRNHVYILDLYFTLPLKMWLWISSVFRINTPPCTRWNRSGPAVREHSMIELATSCMKPTPWWIVASQTP